MNPSQGENLREDDKVPNVEEEEHGLVQVDEQIGRCEESTAPAIHCPPTPRKDR